MVSLSIESVNQVWRGGEPELGLMAGRDPLYRECRSHKSIKLSLSRLKWARRRYPSHRSPPSLPKPGDNELPQLPRERDVHYRPIKDGHNTYGLMAALPLLAKVQPWE